MKVEPQAEKTEQQPVISDSARDKFFLTAADPTTEISPEERLKQVIKAKLSRFTTTVQLCQRLRQTSEIYGQLYEYIK